MANWVKLDLSVCDNPPEFISRDDRCFYLRDYLVDKATHTPRWKLNQDVTNFKIKPTELVANPSRVKYKKKSTELFARELAALIPRPVVLVPIPGSKTATHADFDDRLTQVLVKAQALNPKIHLAAPFTRTIDIESRHSTPGPRSPQIHLDSITCASIPPSTWPVIDGSPGTELYLVDDVLTSGSSFRACKQLLLAAHPGLAIGGIFWARTKPIMGLPGGTDVEAIAKAVGLPQPPPKQG